MHRLVELKGDYVGSHEFRGQAAYYLKGIPRSARAKAALNEVDSEAEMRAVFDNFLEEVNDFLTKRAAHRARIS